MKRNNTKQVELSTIDISNNDNMLINSYHQHFCEKAELNTKLQSINQHFLRMALMQPYTPSHLKTFIYITI